MAVKEVALIVEDDAVFSKIVAHMVKNLGLIPVQYYNFEDAINFVDDIVVFFVLTDIFMPGMGGIEGIRVLKERFSHAKIIAMSGGDGSSKAETALDAAIKAGADFSLKKPFSADELKEAFTQIGWQRN